MFYIKEPVDLHEIEEGVTIHIDLNEKIIHYTCPGCGASIKATAHEITNDLVLHDVDDAVYCANCSAKLLQVRKEAAETSARAETLRKWVPDDKRDKLMAVSVLWMDYRNRANVLGENHACTLDARRLLERVMEGPLSRYRDEIQDTVLAVWESFDENIEDAAEGNKELAGFYRRVLGQTGPEEIRDILEEE